MLKPDPSQPGLWVNDTWTDGTCGTFALIAGVSAYPHLDGSERCFGMGSLFVSALTAQRFFEWVSQEYVLSGCPLAKVRVLLGPTEAERALCAATPAPTFNNFDETIQAWFGDMSGLPPEAAAGSRSLFFFSGHGLEIMEDRQILLPSDYLQPGRPLDRAVSTQNLARGLKALAVPLHFLFLDACRNDHNNLGNVAPLEGTRILNEPSNRAINPDAFVPIFYGSGAGSQAFQPNDPTRGLSLFGDALLEGLEAKGLQPDCSGNSCRVRLHLLRPFVDRRVRDIAKARFGEDTGQRVRVRGDQTEEPVTEVPAPSPPPAVEALTRSAPQAVPAAAPQALPAKNRRVCLYCGKELGFLRALVDHDFCSKEHRERFNAPAEELVLRKLEIERSSPAPSSPPQAPPAPVLPPPSPPAASSPTSRSVKMIARNRPTPPREIRADADHPRYEFADGDDVYWFDMPVEESPLFRCEVVWQRNPRRLTRFDVNLAEENSPPLAAAAKLWRIYDDAAGWEAMRQVPEALDPSAQSPLSAAIGALVLLRTKSWEGLEDWPFPDTPDGIVLRTEYLLRGVRDEEAALQVFRRLERLPYFTESLGYALRQSEQFAGTPMQEGLRNAVAKLRSGGLIATYVK